MAELLLRPVTAMPDFLDAQSYKVWAVPDGRGKGKAWLGGIHQGKRLVGKAAGARVTQSHFKQGYALKFFVPATAIQKKPFSAGQSLRFNLLVDDAEKVRETYWSAHQGQLTTEKPQTWGLIRFVP
jgi:hypothetical protein